VGKGRKHQASYVYFYEYYETEALIWLACIDAGGLDRFDSAIYRDRHEKMRGSVLRLCKTAK
jgi:hypothetical protein